MPRLLAVGLVVAIAVQGAPVTVWAQSQPAATQAADCGCEGSERPDVLAIVDGVKIAAADVEKALADSGYPTWADVEDTRQSMYKYLIDEKLVDREAHRRGVSLSGLMQTEVYSKVKPPTDAELRAVYVKHADELKVPFDRARPQAVDLFRQDRVDAELASFGARLRAAWHAKVADKLPAAPLTPKDRSTVVAEIDAGNITLGDVDDELRSLLYATRYGAYVGAKSIVDEKIDDALIANEAARRGVTVDALVASEIAPKVHAVTSADVTKYVADNAARFVDQALSDVEVAIRAQIARDRVAAAKHEFAAPARKAASVEIFLAEPSSPTYSIDVSDRPMRGNPSAAVTLVEFADFECPHCAAAQPMIDALVKDYGDRIRVVACSFPLSNHPHAFKAAEAAQAAAAQGKYWEYAALLFANSESMTERTFGAIASQVGLDRVTFDQALAAGTYNERVARDMRDGWKLGVVGTPWFFINGKVVADDSPAAIRAQIDAALAAAH